MLRHRAVEIADLPLQLLHRVIRLRSREPHRRAGLIDDIDGLVRKVPLIDIPRAEAHRRIDGLV